jgi:hypothetical protein
MFYEGYNSFTQTISELSAIGVHTRLLWVVLGALYSVLLIAFGVGIRRSADQNKGLRITGTLLFLYGTASVAWPLFPMHQREVLAAGGDTVSDTMHLVMAMISSLFMIAAMGFGGAALGKNFMIYSIATIVVLLIFGTLTAFDAASVQANLPTPWLGVWERIMIGAFVLWIIVLAVIVLQKQKMGETGA